MRRRKWRRRRRRRRRSSRLRRIITQLTNRTSIRQSAWMDGPPLRLRAWLHVHVPRAPNMLTMHSYRVTERASGPCLAGLRHVKKLCGVIDRCGMQLYSVRPAFCTLPSDLHCDAALLIPPLHFPPPLHPLQLLHLLRLIRFFHTDISQINCINNLTGN